MHYRQSPTALNPNIMFTNIDCL